MATLPEKTNTSPAPKRTPTYQECINEAGMVAGLAMQLYVTGLAHQAEAA